MPDLEITRPDGKTIRAYLATPAHAPHGSVVVIQEYWGLNDNIRHACDRFAEAGFRALAPDLYKGKLATTSDEASHTMRGLDFGEAVSQDLRAATAHLKSLGPEAIGVTGFCMGGALTLLAAMKLSSEIAAGACFYGIPSPQAGDPSTISIPLQLHFATHDDWCNAKAVDALEKHLKAGKVRYELFHYEAHHAFMNETRPEVYDAAAAKTAFARTVAFFEANLGKR
jgi:carboxymethylenebutenolidase